MSDGMTKFQEAGMALKASVQKDKEQEAVALAQASSEVMAMFKRTAKLGTEDINGDRLPYLKITESNSKNELLEGSLATAGTFYYAPTRAQLSPGFEVSIMTVSRGFHTKQLDKKTNQWIIKFNQLIGGMLLETMQPFVMFSSGTRWPYMNEFVKSIHPFTKHKEQPIPMYAFRVTLGLEEIRTENGRNYIVNYGLVREEKVIQITTDKNVLDKLENGIELMKDAMNAFIEANEVDKATGDFIKDQASSARKVTPIEEATAPQDADFKDSADPFDQPGSFDGGDDDIPF